MINRVYYKIFLSAMAVLLLVSCKTLDMQGDINMMDLPKWTLSVNQMIKYPRASIGEKEIPTFNGETVWVRKHYEFNSKSIKKITVLPTADPDKVNLQLSLDKQGSMIAMRLCNEKIHPPWGLSIDGVYYKTIEFKKAEDTKFDDYSEVIIDAYLPKEIADALVKYAEPNYEHFHKNDDTEDL
ncbi:MAG TPA: hypothetical protein DD381_08500 [Lentisphaeria bacterium]|nr:MAG: hypothetical protein A2X47_11185 [Lentisphaerae bacterium GWF2_38_69]HBM16362.1 hypothetical protein [Lentisphaeria bacterium]